MRSRSPWKSEIGRPGSRNDGSCFSRSRRCRLRIPSRGLSRRSAGQRESPLAGPAWPGEPWLQSRRPSTRSVPQEASRTRSLSQSKSSMNMGGCPLPGKNPARPNSLSCPSRSRSVNDKHPVCCFVPVCFRARFRSSTGEPVKATCNEDSRDFQAQNYSFAILFECPTDAPPSSASPLRGQESEILSPGRAFPCKLPE